MGGQGYGGWARVWGVGWYGEAREGNMVRNWYRRAAKNMRSDTLASSLTVAPILSASLSISLSTTPMRIMVTRAMRACSMPATQSSAAACEGEGPIWGSCRVRVRRRSQLCALRTAVNLPGPSAVLFGPQQITRLEPTHASSPASAPTIPDPPAPKPISEKMELSHVCAVYELQHACVCSARAVMR